MKEIILVTSLLFGTVGPAASQDNARDELAFRLRDSDVRISCGISVESVRLLLGSPNEVVSHDVWIYWDFYGKGVRGAEKYNTLVLVLKNEKVTALRLCDSKPVRELVARLKTTAGTTTVATK